MDELKLRIQSGPWYNGVECLLIKGKTYGKVITLEEYTEDCVLSPTFRLERHNAQLLMDDLWQAGLRPTEGTGSAGALKATQEHLKDMRKIVEDLLQKVLKNG